MRRAWNLALGGVLVAWSSTLASQGDVIKRIEYAYRAVQSYEGQVEIEKNGTRETLRVRYEEGKSEVEGLSGPRAGKKIIVGKDVVRMKVLGVFVPVPTPDRYQKSGGDVGAGYILSRLEEEAERKRNGTPIQTSVIEDPEKIIIESDYTGSGHYRYKKAVVVIDKRLMLPVSASYDTDGKPGYEEVYRLEYASIKRKGAGLRALRPSGGAGG